MTGVTENIARDRLRNLNRSDARTTEGSEGTVAATRLRSFIERVERLEEERAALNADIREVYAEAKGEGYDVVILRQVVRLRKKDAAERAEAEAMLDLYMSTLGEK